MFVFNSSSLRVTLCGLPFDFKNQIEDIDNFSDKFKRNNGKTY